MKKFYRLRDMLVTIFCLFLVSMPAKSAENELQKAVVEISAAPDWRRIPFPSNGTTAARLVNTLLKYKDYCPEKARILVKMLINTSGKTLDLDVGGKIYIFNRLYINVPESSKRADWKVFGGWGGIAVDDHRINSMYPLVLSNGEFKLEQFSGYGGPPYQALEEFDWLLKRFGPRFKTEQVSPEK